MTFHYMHHFLSFLPLNTINSVTVTEHRALHRKIFLFYHTYPHLWPRAEFTLMRIFPSKATLLAFLTVSHTTALPHTNCSTFLSWPAHLPGLIFTTSTIILAPGSSLSRAFRGLTWAHPGEMVIPFACSNGRDRVAY